MPQENSRKLDYQQRPARLTINANVSLDVERYYTFVPEEGEQVLYHINVIKDYKTLKSKYPKLPMKIYMVNERMQPTPEEIHRAIEKHFKL